MYIYMYIYTYIYIYTYTHTHIHIHIDKVLCYVTYGVVDCSDMRQYDI